MLSGCLESYYDGNYLIYSHNHSPHLGKTVVRILTDGKFLFQKRLSLKGFLCGLLFFTGKIAMQNNFRELEELVFFDLWILLPILDS